VLRVAERALDVLAVSDEEGVELCKGLALCELDTEELAATEAIGEDVEESLRLDVRLPLEEPDSL
jgi:hypothetical protein